MDVHINMHRHAIEGTNDNRFVFTHDLVYINIKVQRASKMMDVQMCVNEHTRALVRTYLH